MMLLFNEITFPLEKLYLTKKTMKQRILLNQYLLRISQLSGIPLIEDLDEKIKTNLENSTKLPISINKKRNIFFNLKTNTKLNLNKKECLNIENLLYKNLIELTSIPHSKLHLSNLQKLNLNEYQLTGFLLELNSIIPIKQSIHHLFYNTLLKNNSDILAYKHEFKVGRQFITLLYNNLLNKKNINKQIKITEEIANTILLEIIHRKTPRPFNIYKLFNNFCKLLNNNNKDLLNLIIFSNLYFTQFSQFFMSKNILIQQIRKQQQYQDFWQYNDIELFKILKSRILNIINIYAKKIGTEITKMYLDLNLIALSKKIIKGNNTYIITNNFNFYSFLSDNLPRLYLEKNLTFHSKSFNKKQLNLNIETHQVFQAMIQNDRMDGIVTDSSFWHKSMGKSQLNIIFLKEIFKNIFYILKKKNRKEKTLVLNENQIVLIEQLFGINCSAIQKLSTFNNFLYFCFDFSSNPKLNFEIDSQAKMIVDKVKTQKYIFAKIIRFIHILIRFSHFEFEQKFDVRGRAYPYGLLNHHHPQFKLFFTFKRKNIKETPVTETNVKVKTAMIIASYLKNYNVCETTVAFINEMLDKNQKNKIKEIPLIKFCTLKNKAFESYLYYNDLINLMIKNYTEATCYKVDARGSGFQIISMLLNLDTLAQSCGLNSTEDDLYTKFVKFYHSEKHSQKIFMHRITDNEIFEELCKILITKNNEELLRLLNGENLDLMAKIYPLFDFEILKKLFPFSSKNKLFLKYIEKLPKFQALGFFPNTEEKKKKNKFKKCEKWFCIFLSLVDLFIENPDEIYLMGTFSKFVTRKFVKNAIMTYFYGSSLISRCDQYKEYFLDILNETGENLNDFDMNEFKAFAIKLDLLITKWILKYLPESLILRNAIKSVCKSKTFINTIINSNHCLWYYCPLEKDSFSKSILSKDYKLIKYTDKIDYAKIGSSFLANYIQFCDAIICANIIKIFHFKNIPIKTTHDCFATPYKYSDELNSAIYLSYINFLNADYLKQHFSINNPELYKKILDKKSKFNNTPINITTIPIDASSLVKF